MRVRNAAVVVSLALATSLGFSALDSEERVKMNDLPEAVQKTVLEVSKGLKLRELTREVEKGETFYEAELEVNGHTRDVLIDPTGAVVLIEEEVEWSSVPAAAQAAIEKAAGGGKVVLVESLSRNDRVEVYEAHVRKGWKRFEVKVDPDGKAIVEK